MRGTYVRLAELKLERTLRDPQLVSDVLFPEVDDGNVLDIDKAWHAIHFLLNADPWNGHPPLHDAVLGGAEFGEDRGYGPPRYLRPAEVANVAAALRSISGDVLWSRFSQQDFADAEIYPHGWTGTDDEKNYILAYYDKLREFFDTASLAGQAVVLCLT